MSWIKIENNKFLLPFFNRFISHFFTLSLSTVNFLLLLTSKEKLISFHYIFIIFELYRKRNHEKIINTSDRGDNEPSPFQHLLCISKLSAFMVTLFLHLSIEQINYALIQIEEEEKSEAIFLWMSCVWRDIRAFNS